MKQSMQGAAATANQSNVMKDAGAKRGMMSCEGNLDTGGSHLEKMCFPLASNLDSLSVCMCITCIHF